MPQVGCPIVAQIWDTKGLPLSVERAKRAWDDWRREMSDFRRHLDALPEDSEFKSEWDVQAAEREVMARISEDCLEFFSLLPGSCWEALFWV